jgi:hypothetical protein
MRKVNQSQSEKLFYIVVNIFWGIHTELISFFCKLKNISGILSYESQFVLKLEEKRKEIQTGMGGDQKETLLLYFSILSTSIMSISLASYRP